MAKWLEGLETTLGKGNGGPKRVRTLRWLLVIGGIGAALMLMNSFLSFQRVPPPQDQTQQTGAPPDDQTALAGTKSGSSFDDIERPLESRLKEILQTIVGVGPLDVMVMVDSTEEVVTAIDEKESQQITNETDKNGGKRSITSITKEGQVVLYDTDGERSPIIVKRIQPKIRGVLIVAQGAENGTVRRLIIDAVEKGLNVAVNRISVIPRKQQ
ncbi:stage III sporulation protein AG [Paenibacillus sacheonensis]|uniref:Stage III sporulation protein AG n=1 Tax=Paenibacillus sacheonensis TaxID=742054 RepID=A0A7X4YNX3_9BACL|nr:stage III sporulation protein AG [Paenibacillus sacheonensis]MBM7564371.1 stage III sporulation protein AG [Paenibacillus sacheonensis]NBC68934.1 stage III sporulation protein AG [Paenibacillus sacheonensis]